MKQLIVLFVICMLCAGCVNQPETVDFQATIQAAVDEAVAEALAGQDYVTAEELEASQAEQNRTIQDYVLNQMSASGVAEYDEPEAYEDASGGNSAGITRVVPTATTAPYTFSNCTNSFAYVSDVNVPDGASITRNTVFTKSWYITNTGTCTWNSNYKMVYYSGDQVGTAEEFSFLGSDYYIKPGESTVVSVEIQASDQVNARYTTQWAMKTPSGEIIGAGDQKNLMLSSSYVVSKTYSFVQNFSSATCTDSTGSFVCGITSRTKGRGIAYYDGSPTLESGVDGDPAFVLGVPYEESGKARVAFNSIRMPRGSYFYTNFCCRQSTPGCDVIVRLYIQEEGEPEKLLIEREKYNTGYLDEFKFKLDDMGIYENDYKYIFEVEAVGPGDKDDEIIFMNAQLY